MKRGDRLLGIFLGLALGLAIVAVFIFVFSQETVDEPKLDQATPQSEEPADR